MCTYIYIWLYTGTFPFGFLCFYKYFSTKNTILFMNKLFMLGVNSFAYRK